MSRSPKGGSGSGSLTQQLLSRHSLRAGAHPEPCERKQRCTLLLKICPAPDLWSGRQCMHCQELTTNAVHKGNNKKTGLGHVRVKMNHLILSRRLSNFYWDRAMSLSTRYELFNEPACARMEIWTSFLSTLFHVPGNCVHLFTRMKNHMADTKIQQQTPRH